MKTVQDFTEPRADTANRLQKVYIGWMPDSETETSADFYCPQCKKPVREPLVCGDCHALICRDCGTPLETVDELGMG